MFNVQRAVRTVQATRAVVFAQLAINWIQDQVYVFKLPISPAVFK